MSSLAFHYVESFDRVAKNVHRMLATGGQFVFSVEHPVFTAEGSQQWHTDDKGTFNIFPLTATSMRENEIPLSSAKR